jgi:hypothetical protein
MDTNEKQIALSVLESLRGDLKYAHLKDGSPVLDVPDFREYLYEMMGRIRTTALEMSDLYDNHNGHGQTVNNGNGHSLESASVAS